MLFLPYKMDVTLYRIPVLTALVMLACLVTFLSQKSSSEVFHARLQSYCSGALEPNLGAILRRIDSQTDTAIACVNVFMALRNSNTPEVDAATLATSVRGLIFYRDPQQNLRYLNDKLMRGLAGFELRVPRQLTESRQYNPKQYNFLRMISSTFAHADWEHLLGNLFFFYIFATCVESALGYLHFALSIVVMAVVTSLAYSYSAGNGADLPTIGLSGVAMGMMALIGTLLPQARVRCLFWFLLWIRRFSMPVMLIGLWYIGWNVYDLQTDDGSSHINYMAHVSGAATGVVLGLLYRWLAAERVQQAALGVG